MIARNFLEGNANMLYPQIDMAGNQTGIIGSEFPFYNYLIYLVSSIFGYTHWYGRLINLLVSSIGIYYFYLLVEKVCTRKVAFNAALILLSSIWFAFSRKIMPDTFSVALVIIGLYYGYLYITTGAIFKLMLYFLFATLGMLCKIPALSLISVISVLLIAREIPLKTKITVFAATALSVAVVGIWYFYWVPYLLDLYHYQLYFPKGIKDGIKEILPLMPDVFEKFYFNSLCSYIAFVFFLVGSFFLFKSKNYYLKTGILAITGTFLIFILKTGAVFPLHSYYIIPFTPVMALIAGYGISKFPTKYAYILLLLISLEGIGNQQHDFFIADKENYLLTLDGITRNNIPKDKLIVINGGNSPQEIYFAHRKGWTVENDKVNKEELNCFRKSGASFLILDKHKISSTLDYYPLIYSDDNFKIYEMKDEQPPGAL